MFVYKTLLIADVNYKIFAIMTAVMIAFIIRENKFVNPNELQQTAKARFLFSQNRFSVTSSQNLLFDCQRVLAYAKIRTVLQSKDLVKVQQHVRNVRVLNILQLTEQPFSVCNFSLRSTHKTPLRTLLLLTFKHQLEDK